MSFKIVQSFMFLFLFVISCKKDNSAIEKSYPISIRTDKVNYNSNEKIIVTLKNNSDSTFYFLICNGNQKPTGSVEKYENNSWNVVYSTVCLGFGTYWGGKILKGQQFNDTIKVKDLKSGVFRFSYGLDSLNSKMQFDQLIFYSNTFTIK